MTPIRRTRTGRAQDRGVVLMLALGFICAIAVAVMYVFMVASEEAEAQGIERRQRQAFFAAEAALADAREVARIMLGADQSYTTTITTLGDNSVAAGNPQRWVDEGGLPGPAEGAHWYEIIPETDYSLTRGAGEALDDSISGPMAETCDPTGTPLVGYPEYVGVSYRAFLKDDDDGDSNGDGTIDVLDYDVDTNRKVWLVAVGSVTTGDGMPTRAVVQALITNSNTDPPSGSGSTQAFSDEQNSGANNTDTGNIDLTQGTSVATSTGP